MKNNTIGTYWSFYRLDIIIYLAFLWCIIEIVSIILYVNKSTYAWYIMSFSLIIIAIILIFSKKSKQILNIFEDRLEIYLPKTNFTPTSKRIKKVIYIKSISNIYIDKKKKSSIVIEYDSKKLILNYFFQPNELISTISKCKRDIFTHNNHQ